MDRSQLKFWTNYRGITLTKISIFRIAIGAPCCWEIIRHSRRALRDVIRILPE